MAELATAYLTLVPSLKGAQESIERQLAGVNVAPVGVSMGQDITDGLSGKISGGLAKTGQVLSKVFTGPVSKGVMAIGGAVTALTATGGIHRALNIEKAQTTLKGLGMDVDSVMQSANEAVLGTAFSLDSAAIAASLLGAAGVASGDQMTRSLKMVAGIAATTGGSMEDIADIMSTVAANGKVSCDELNRLSARGINATSILSKALGKSGAEIRDMVSKGQVDFQMFSDAMYDAFGEAAYGANETFSGSLANMRAALSRLGAKFADPALKGLTKIFNELRLAINEVSKLMDPLVDKFSKFVSEGVERASRGIANFTGALRDGASPLEALGTAMSVAFGYGTAQNIQAIASAVGLLAAAGPMLKLAAAGMDAMSKATNAVAPVVKTVAGGLSSMAGAVGSFAATLSGSALAAVKAFGGTLWAAFAPDKVFSFFEQLPLIVSGKLNILSGLAVNSFKAMKEGIGGALGNVASFVNQQFAGLPGYISNAIGGAVSTIAGPLGLAAENASKAFASKFNIGQKAEGEVGIVHKAFSSLGNGASTLGKGLLVTTGGLAAVSAGLVVAGAAAVAAGIDLRAAGDQLVTNMNGLSEGMLLLAGQVGEMLPQIVMHVTAALPLFMKAFTTLFSSLLEVLPVVMPMLVDAVNSLVVTLSTTLVDMLPTLLEAGLTLFISLITAFAQMSPTLIAKFPEMVRTVCDVLIRNMPALLNAAFTLFSEIVRALLKMLPDLIGQLPGLIMSFISALLGYMPTLGQNAGQLFGEIARAIPRIAGDVLGALGNLLSQLPGKVAGFAGQMAQAGRNLISGIVNGIGDGASWVISKINSICSNALDAVRNFFGIASPSKVMRKMFGYVGEGMALGLEDSEGRVNGAMEDLIDGAYGVADGFSPTLDASGSARGNQVTNADVVAAIEALHNDLHSIIESATPDGITGRQFGRLVRQYA